MGLMGIRREAILLAIAVCAVLAVLAIPASGVGGKPANTEQVFGVGTRADAMGDAFVAVATDPSAAFWNPAGLSSLHTTELTAVMKSLPRVTQTTILQPAEFGGFPDFNSSIVSDNTYSHTAGSEATFVCVTSPIGRNLARHGTIAISRTLAGYLDRDWTVAQEFQPIEVGDVDVLTTQSHDRLRIDYNSLTYGWTPGRRLSTGFGIVQAEAHALASGTQQQTFLQPGPDPVESSFGPTETVGKGYGAILGILWNPMLRGEGKLTLGGSYLSAITLSGLDSSSFGDQRPDVLLLGANYQQPVPGSGNEVQWSMQLSRNGAANSDAGGQMARQAVWNAYFGGEYDIHSSGLQYLIRYGIFTNKSPNDNVYGDETWMTVGFGTGRLGTDWRMELALQEGLRTGQSLFSLSGGYAF